MVLRPSGSEPQNLPFPLYIHSHKFLQIPSQSLLNLQITYICGVVLASEVTAKRAGKDQLPYSYPQTNTVA